MICACGHDLEDHEKVRVTDGSSFDTFRRCAVPDCTCCDEELRDPYERVRLEELRQRWEDAKREWTP